MKNERTKKIESLNVACWNIRTMQDAGDHPKRLSALVARELARDLDIAALSEVRFAEQGSLTEDGAGYTLFWSQKSEDERRLSGVSFMINTFIARKLQNLPVGHSDRLMPLGFPIKDKITTVLSVYAPTLKTVKEAFYCHVHKLLQQVDSTPKTNSSL